MTDERSAPRKNPVLPPVLSAPHSVAAFALLILGAALIGYGALGDLWLDEIWTLALLEPVKSFGGIIWDIRHDNNHILNSMYLYAVGPNASSIVMRGLSMVFGTASIAAAGLVLARNTAIAGIIAMLLFAASYPPIHYASEARGYAGLVLFSLLALILLQREFDRPRRGNRYALAIVLGLGFLSHLTMLFGAVAFGLWTLWIFWRRTSNLRQTVVSSFITLFPAICSAALVASATLYSALRYGFVVNVHSVPDQFAVGGIDPFEYTGFINAYGKLIGLLAGVPESVPTWLCLGSAAVLIGAAAYLWRNRESPMLSLYVIGMVILPAAVLLAHPANSNFPRYFLFSGVMFLLFLADLASLAWQQAGPLRAIAVVAVLAIVAGDATLLGHFYKDRRGHYSQAVTDMATSGRIVYVTDNAFRTPIVIEYYAKKLGIGTSYVGGPNWCAARPDWVVIENPLSPVLAHTQVVMTVPGCELRINRTAAYPFWGLSGREWVLYRRID